MQESSLSKSFKSTFDNVPLLLTVPSTHRSVSQTQNSTAINPSTPSAVKALTPIKRTADVTSTSSAPMSTASWLSGLIWGASAAPQSSTIAVTNPQTMDSESGAEPVLAESTQGTDHEAEDTATQPIPSLPPPPSALASLHNEAVLYYCACMVSYTSTDMVGSPGFLYLSTHYIGLASRSVIAVGAKRRDLLRLEDLHDAVISGGAHRHEGTSTPSKGTNQSHASSKADSPQQDGAGSVVSSGWSLASIQKTLKISNVTSGCTLRFKLPIVDATNLHPLTPAKKQIDPLQSTVGHGGSNGDSDSNVSFEVTIFPALVEVDKVRAVILEARQMLLGAPPGA